MLKFIKAMVFMYFALICGFFVGVASFITIIFLLAFISELI